MPIVVNVDEPHSSPAGHTAGRGSGMIVFSVICALLILMGLGFILPPLRHPNRLRTVKTVAEANAAVYRRQVTELESDLRHGLITRAQFERDREELEARAVVDLPKESRDEKRETNCRVRHVGFLPRHWPAYGRDDSLPRSWYSGIHSRITLNLRRPSA